MTPALSIIIAVFGERDSLNQTITQLLADFEEVALEIIIVAHPDSATACLDKGKNLAQIYPAVRFFIQQHLPGQGLAYRQGIGEAQGSYILLMNADLETHPPDARKLYDHIIQQGCDMVIASRWSQGAYFDRASYGTTKWVLNYGFQRIFATLFRTRITDLTFCYKIARADIFKSLRWQGIKHEFALETSLVPIALKLSVAEIPTRWVGRKEGVSHFRFWQNIRHLRLAWVLLRYTICGKLERKYR